MASRVVPEQGWATTPTAPFLSVGGIAQALTKGGRDGKDSIARNNAVIFELSTFVKLLDSKEGGLKIRSKAIGPFPIMSYGYNLPWVIPGMIVDASVTFEIRGVLLILQQVRQCY